MIEDDVGDVGAMDEGDPRLPGSMTGTRNARKCCQDLLFIPHHGLHQPVLQHHGAVPGQANQLAVKILELGDVVGEVDELQGGEWLHGASEHNRTKVRGRELVHLLLLHVAIWVEEEEIGSLILEK